jgi:hypothetical protein
MRRRYEVLETLSIESATYIHTTSGTALEIEDGKYAVPVMDQKEGQPV